MLSVFISVLMIFTGMGQTTVTVFAGQTAVSGNEVTENEATEEEITEGGETENPPVADLSEEKIGVVFYDSDGSTPLLSYELIYDGLPVALNSVLKTYKELQLVHSGYAIDYWHCVTTGEDLKCSEVWGKGMTANHSYVAVWKSKPYKFKIDYHLDGGEWSDRQTLSVKDSFTINDSFMLLKPQKKNYIFHGWYLDSAYTQPVREISAVNCVDGTLENGSIELPLYARFSKVSLPVPQIVSAVNEESGKVTVKVDSVSGCEGQEISLSASSDFKKNENTKKLKKGNTVTFTNMPKGKTYYFRTRSYMTDSTGTLCYSEYSEAVPCKITKGVKEYAAKPDSARLEKVQLANASTLCVEAAVPKRLKSADDSYYLVTIDPSTNKYTKMVAKSDKSESIVFEVPLKDQKGTNLIQGKFAIAVKKSSSKYMLISGGEYIANPERAAAYTADFPSAASKKGLQGSLDTGLGIHHTFLNMDLSSVLNGSIPYTYNGKTYHFNDPYGAWISHANAVGLTVSGQIMMTWNGKRKYMILESGRRPGHSYYAINAQSKKARQELEAAFCFLAERYSREDCHLDNWILGNEVNIHRTWYYAGDIPNDVFMKNYADTFRILYYAVKGSSKNARVYICTDHTWVNRCGDWGAMPFMEAFHKEIKSQNKNIRWNLAYHAYPSILTNAKVWEDNVDSRYNCSSSLASDFVSPYNLSVMTNYVKRTFGKGTRIIISEVGFTTCTGYDVQAAALAYSYYKAEFNNMIDAFIVQDFYISNQEDYRFRGASGKKRPAYNVFKYMNTPSYGKYTKKCLKTMDKSSWNQAVKGFRKSKLEKMPKGI